MKSFYDVLIVGGGMVGLTLACALGNSRLRVALIEAKKLPELKSANDYDLRVSAISRASQQVFTSVGAWPAMQNLRVSPFEHMHVWDATGDGEIHFDAADLGVDVLGHLVENRVVQLALLQQLKTFDNIDFLCPVNIQNIDLQTDKNKVQLDDGRIIYAQLLVGADGAQSAVRNAAGINIEQAPYQQKGVVCVVKSKQHHQYTAWQRFLPSGPLAFLPLSDGRCSIVWSADDARADELVAMDAEHFCRELERAFDFTLGSVESVGERAAFPLVRRHAEHYIQQGLALVGDAAHTIHPLAGQGVNLGILDAACLAQVILVADKQKQKFASVHTLRKYERWRRGENTLMMHSMSGLKKLFSNEQMQLSFLRNAGLKMVNQFSPLKNKVMRHAMGLEGDLPEIAKVIGW